MKKQIKHIIKDILLKESEFDVGDAFKFIKQKEGRSLPLEYVEKILKNGPIEKLNIPEDIEGFRNTNYLWILYKFVHAPEKIDQLEYSNLYLDECTALKSLPENLHVKDVLDISRCTSLEEIPRTLSVGGTLLADGCTSLRAIPENLKYLKGIMDISDCGMLSELPEGLSVESLWIGGCPIKELPMHLHISKDLHLDRSDPLVEKYGDVGSIKNYIKDVLKGSVGQITIMKKSPFR